MDPYQGAVGVPVHVTVLRGNNLRGNKNEPFLNFVRAEFNGTQLGDSQKCDAAVDESVNYNFFCSFECSESAHTLDDLAQKPVILTVIEILPKEKKQKEEKTCVLGQAVVDLLPLLHGKCSFSSTVVLHPLPGLPTEIDSLDRGIKPTLEVMVSVQEPLLSDAQLSESNLLTVTVETAFSVPEVWSPGPPSSYVAAMQVPLMNPDIWALYGHWYYLVKDYHQAQKCYERTLDFVTDASDTHHIYIRLGSIYLQSGEYEKAKPIYLRACGSSPSCFTWLGLGSACYRLGELAEAEDALTEANILDNGNPEVWGYLSLVCLKTGRKVEAEQSYKYALKFNLPEEPLLQEIKELQAHVGFGNPCFR
uniref:Cilia and flagella associated protein 70 n=1 Tax=Electrophorus electricus TaxID=8005 RepID=A0A4W4H1T5_ELEEL